MTYNQFIKEYLDKGLLKKQNPDLAAVEKLVLRALKDLTAARANLAIDEGIAFTVAYLAMLHAGRALMLLKAFRPADGYQHKTVVEFTAYFLGEQFKHIINHFDIMRQKRNIFTYEVTISISRTEAENALNTAVQFVDLIRDMLKKEAPQAEFKF
ncbi:MAG: HEPN domain-containing protein [Planctomycetota bacterium]